MFQNVRNTVITLKFTIDLSLYAFVSHEQKITQKHFHATFSVTHNLKSARAYSVL